MIQIIKEIEDLGISYCKERKEIQLHLDGQNYILSYKGAHQLGAALIKATKLSEKSPGNKTEE